MLSYMVSKCGRARRLIIWSTMSVIRILSKTIVLSNSDGGPGYTAAVFEDILGRTKRHEDFLDSYHEKTYVHR